MATKEEGEKKERERTEWDKGDNMAFASERNYASALLAHDSKG